MTLHPIFAAICADHLGVDPTPLAIREQAFADMLANARKFDGSYEAAKARFDAAAPQQENRL